MVKPNKFTLTLITGDKRIFQVYPIRVNPIREKSLSLSILIKFDISYSSNEIIKSTKLEALLN